MELHGSTFSNRLYFTGITTSWSLVATTKPNLPIAQPYQPMQPYSPKHISCVGKNHAIVNLWDDLTGAIQLLNTENIFRHLNCCRIGHAGNVDTEDPVVVLLHVKAGILSTTDGVALANRIYEEYLRLYVISSGSSGFSLPMDLTVEIVEIIPCSTTGSGGMYIEGPPFLQNIHPGGSIGCYNSDSSGSAGAFFEAKLESGDFIKVLLTNHQNNPSANISCPSPQDIAFSHRSRADAIEALNQRIGRMKEQLVNRFLERAFATELERAIETLSAQVGSLQKDLAVLVQENPTWSLASCVSTSGWRSDNSGHQMNWGLAALTQDFSSPNTLPDFTPRIKLKVEAAFEHVPSSITAISNVPLQTGEMVIKYGRTTGWAIGYVNECLSYHFACQAQGETSKSFAIFGEKGVPFCESGDSGSVALNAKGELAALLFASDPFGEELHGGFAFATEISRVIADIQLQTSIRDMKLLTE